MKMLFDFVKDIGNYQKRKVGHDKFPWGMISTALVSDGKKRYETAIEHPEYRGGKIVIVEAYDGIEIAREGHAKWVALMTADKLPDTLEECCNSSIEQLLKEFSEDYQTVFPRQVKKNELA